MFEAPLGMGIAVDVTSLAPARTMQNTTIDATTESVQQLAAQAFVHRGAPFKHATNDTTASHFQAAKGDYVVFETAAPRDLRRVSLLELQHTRRQAQFIPALPKESLLYKELAGVELPLLHELCVESNRVIREEALQERNHETWNGLVAYKEGDDITDTPLGDQISCSRISHFEDLNQMSIRTVETVKPQAFSIQQLQVSGEKLGSLFENCRRLVAARSSFGISIFGWTGDELRPLARIKQIAERITDLQFCPYSFPELAFSCSNGSLHVVNLEPLTEIDTVPAELLTEEIVRPNRISGTDEENGKCLCIYGLHPRQLLLARNNQIYQVDRSGGETDVSDVVTYSEREQIQCLQTTQASVTSLVHDTFLLAVLSNKRVRLHDLRTFPDVILSWDILHSLSIPDSLQFSLEPLEEAEECPKGTLLGRILYGDRTNGEFKQAIFLIGDPQMAVAVQREEQAAASGGGLQLRRGEQIEDDIHICHTRFRRYLDTPSTLCHSLELQDQEIHFKAIHLVSYTIRLQKKNQRFLRTLPTVDVQRWKELLRHEVELMGFQILPLVERGHSPGLLFRMNAIGDLIILQLNLRSDREATGAGSSAQSCRRVVREDKGEVVDEYRPEFRNSRVDLKVFDLDICPRDRRLQHPEMLSAAEKLRYSMPQYLMSSFMVNSIVLIRARPKTVQEGSLTVTGRSGRCTTSTSLPMTFHTEHFSESPSTEIPLEDRMLMPNVESEIQKVIKIETGKSLWRCIHEIRWNSPTMVKGNKLKRGSKRVHAGPEKEFDISLAHSVTWDMTKERRETLQTVLSLMSYDDCLAEQLALKDIILKQAQSNVAPKLTAIHVQPLPPAAESDTDGRWNEKWKSLGELYGADIVFVPVQPVKESETEAMVSFGEAKFDPCVNLPSTAEAEESLKEMESLWKRDWKQLSQLRPTSIADTGF